MEDDADRDSYQTVTFALIALEKTSNVVSNNARDNDDEQQFRGNIPCVQLEEEAPDPDGPEVPTPRRPSRVTRPPQRVTYNICGQPVARVQGISWQPHQFPVPHQWLPRHIIQPLLLPPPQLSYLFATLLLCLLLTLNNVKVCSEALGVHVIFSF